MRSEILGIDAGGTWIKAARFDADGQELARSKVPSGAAQGKEAYLASIQAAARHVEGLGLPVGVAVPGVFTKDRAAVIYLANVRGMANGGPGLRLQEELGTLLGTRQVTGSNDAKCAALAEWRRGQSQGDPDQCLLHLTWGTGLGTGLVVGGVPQHGWEGGHLPFHPLGTTDEWSLQIDADLEKHIAVPAMVRLAREWHALGKFETKLLAAELEDTKRLPLLLSEYGQAGDPLSRAVVQRALSGMAWALQVMAVISYPDIVTIGGAMMDSDWLLEELRVKVGEFSRGFLQASLRSEQVFRATLGNDAGVIGAAMLAREKFVK